jgi:CheY-like chemotaxis protein
VVRADEKRLRQILINVLGNAVKFTARGSVTFKVEYRREMAVFDIRDTGPGIPADDLERIFEPFERGSTAQAGGSGVGLTIARMLTDLMGGEMQRFQRRRARARCSASACFCRRCIRRQAAGELPRGKRIGYVGVRRRILVVDNEKVDRDMLQSVLEPLGFVLEQAASGEECAQAAIPRFAPHLVFMDLGMPGIDGWETLRRIRQQQLTGAHLAMLSANAFDKGLDNDAGIAPDDFIVKPLRCPSCSTGLAASCSSNGSAPTARRLRPPPPRRAAAAHRAARGPPRRAGRTDRPGLPARHSRRKLGEIERLEAPRTANSCASCAIWHASSSSTR